jgi:hypothetical protein
MVGQIIWQHRIVEKLSIDSNAEDIAPTICRSEVLPMTSSRRSVFVTE